MRAGFPNAQSVRIAQWQTEALLDGLVNLTYCFFMNEDVAAIRQLLEESYAVISGPAGARNWSRHSELFIDSARLVVLHPIANGYRIESLSVKEYEESRDAFFRRGSFYETEVGCDVTVSGDLAHAMSRYESRWDPSEAPFETGVNSVQLARLNGAWKIVSIMWTAGLAAARVHGITSAHAR